MRKNDFIEVDICHRMGPLWMLYSMTLTNFQAQIFKVVILMKAGKCKHWYCYQIGIRVFPIEFIIIIIIIKYEKITVTLSQPNVAGALYRVNEDMPMSVEA